MNRDTLLLTNVIVQPSPAGCLVNPDKSGGRAGDYADRVFPPIPVPRGHGAAAFSTNRSGADSDEYCHDVVDQFSIVEGHADRITGRS